jgi:predicted NAD/FAD-dependent oxidoreductase
MGYAPRVAVVGGGISGLVLAKELTSRGFHAVCFDTGERATGGRLSSRRFRDNDGRDVAFDHSTQYFTVDDPRFEALAKEWAAEGLIAPWPNSAVGVLDATSGRFRSFDDATTRWIGVDGWTPLCEFLAEGAHEVVRPQWVGAMTPVGGDGAKRRWELASGPGGKPLGTFDFVAVSHNGKCALRLASTAKHLDGSPAATTLQRSLQCAFGVRPTAELAKQR